MFEEKINEASSDGIDAYRFTVHAGRVVDGTTNLLWNVEYDPQLNVVAVRDPLGRAAESYVLDGNERVVAATNLEGQVAAVTYLFGGLVSSRARFDGTVVTYAYDDGGDVERIAYPDATLAFTHDPDGLLTSASNTVGVVSNEYDASTGWLVSTRGADGALVSYAHHLGGGVASMSSPAGVVSNTLDVAGRKDKLFTPSGTVGFGYCSWNGKLAVVTNANGTTTSYAYDVIDRVTNITWTTVDGLRIGGFSYVYDAIGRIVSRSHDLGVDVFNRTYTYDDFDRLASDGDVSYTYDAAGNRMMKIGDVEGDVSYTLGVGDRLASWTGGSYTYDDAGCVTCIERVGKPTLDLTWDSQYQLISVATNGVFAEGYSYDALGRRVATTTFEGTIRHVYDNNWQCIADVDTNGNVLCSYVWGEGIDNMLAVKIDDETYTALTDIQGTVWGFTDGNGEVVAHWTYDAWGNVLSSNVTVPALASLRYRFQGREWFAVTGLMNFRMRWYDAETGRWLSKDPIGLNGGVNLYAFCENIPLGCLDPFGLARFGIRGLEAPVIGVQTTLAMGVTTAFAPITMLAVWGNLGMFHEHIFFDDGKSPSNLGYFDNGVRCDKVAESEYHMYGPIYDDAIMRKAINNLIKSGQWNKKGKVNGYDLIRHNCQDFAEAARQEYERLGGRTRK